MALRTRPRCRRASDWTSRRRPTRRAGPQTLEAKATYAGGRESPASALARERRGDRLGRRVCRIPDVRDEHSESTPVDRLRVDVEHGEAVALEQADERRSSPR